eukprot:GFUD01040025.1.p1 GENE.GFUD01040025.1~~GFUD01040025.1.p1  ORF type:complete len:379 (+),score=86.98 GFUD01040025.1:119-1255(+)
MTVNKKIFTSLKKSKVLSLNKNPITRTALASPLLEKSRFSCLPDSSTVYPSRNFTTTKYESAALKKLDKVASHVHGEVPAITDEDTKMVIEEPASHLVSKTGSTNSVVLLFGWAGASHKNLNKYSSIYLEAGFTTVQFILSTRHIFRDTDQIPELMSKVMDQMGQQGLLDRPMYIHCLSDTGVMCYQGLDIASKQRSTVRMLNIQGVVWDSCPGPYPEVTLSRISAFLIVNWLCCMNDKLGVVQSLHSSYRLLLDRGWPNLLRRWQGKPVTLNMMNGIWCGHFGRDHHLQFPLVPELHLYSDKDFYLPYKYLEKEVLAIKEESGADYTAVKFVGSPHVSHLKRHKKKYKSQVLAFIVGNMKPVEETEKFVMRRLHRNS